MMPTQTFAEYSTILANSFHALHLIRQFDRYEFQSDQRTLQRGLLQGTLWFANGAELHWREFIDTALPIQRLMYAYHFQDADKRCIFRYDNAPHRIAPHLVLLTTNIMQTAQSLPFLHLQHLKK